MSAADDIINKHRQRLEEHKQFLGGGGEKQRHQERASSSGGSGGRQLSGRSTGSHEDPTSAREYTDRSSQQQQRRFQGGNDHRDAAGDHRGGSPSTRRASGVGSYGGLGGGGYDEEIGGSPLNATARSQSKLTDGEELGTYYTDDPTRVFEDNYRWQMKRERSLAEQKKERFINELEECTFKPNTNFSSGQQHQRQAAGSLSQEREPMYGAGADASMTNHVLRQRQGRHEKEQAQRRVNGNIDVKNWEPRTTKPVEFNLGRKGDGISALRKPIAWQSGGAGGNSDNNQLQRRRGGAQQQQPTRSNYNQQRVVEGDNFGNSIKGEEEGGGMDHNRKRVQMYRQQRGNYVAGGVNHNNDHQRQHDDEEPASPQQQITGGGAGLPPLEVVEAMDQTITNQELEIARLKGIIQAQRRELDVAKAKVRQMALSSQQAQCL